MYKSCIATIAVRGTEYVKTSTVQWLEITMYAVVSFLAPFTTINLARVRFHPPRRALSSDISIEIVVVQFSKYDKSEYISLH